MSTNNRRARKSQIDVQVKDKDLNDIILTMNQPTRSKEDGEFLSSKLTQLQYFNIFIENYLKGSQNDSLVNICRYLKLSKFEAGTILFTEGDQSNNKLYMILDGSVCLMKRNVFDFDLENRKSLKGKDLYNGYYQKLPIENKILFQTLIRSVQQQNSNDDSPLKIDQESLILEFCVKYGGILRTLKRGDGFGEKALLENKNRTLTAIIQETSYLIMLEKADFDVVREAFEFKIKQRKDLLYNLFQDVMTEYSTNRLEQMTYSLKSLEMEKGQVLVKTGEKSDLFYMLEDGEVKIYQTLDQDTPIPLSVITPGQFIGEEIILNSKYEFTGIISSQTANLLVVSKKAFFSQFPQECRKSVITTYEHKKKTRISNLLRFNENDAFLNMRSTFCARNKVSRGTRAKQLLFWQKNDAIDIDQTYKDFGQSFRSPINTPIEYEGNRQAINLQDLRVNPKKFFLQEAVSDTNLQKFQKTFRLPSETQQQSRRNDHTQQQSIEFVSQPQNNTVRGASNNDFSEILKIVESTKNQFNKKVTEESIGLKNKNYGFFINDHVKPPNDDLKQIMSKQQQQDQQPPKSKQRLDFGRGDMERQLRKEHFFQIVKSTKPLRLDYMDHDFHILKNVISQKYLKSYKNSPNLSHSRSQLLSPNMSQIINFDPPEIKLKKFKKQVNLVTSLQLLDILQDNGPEMAQTDRYSRQASPLVPSYIDKALANKYPFKIKSKLEEKYFKNQQLGKGANRMKPIRTKINQKQLQFIVEN